MRTKAVVDDLISMALSWGLHRHHPRHNPGKPGEIIEKLSKEERQICASLTGRDFQHRIPSNLRTSQK